VSLAAPPLDSGALWIVTDQLPYPPRNGITLPLFHYTSRLMVDRPVRLIVLVNADAPLDPKALAENEKLFGPIKVIALERVGRWRRIRNELSAKEMYQHGWKPSSAATLDDLPKCNALLVSPISAVAKWRATGLGVQVTAGAAIAGVNDCTTSEYFYRGRQQVGGLRHALKGWLDRQRCRFIAPVEAQLLSDYDHVLLQTATDRELMSCLVSPQTAERVTLVPNGVTEDYFRLSRTGGHKVVFVAELSGEYAGIVHWLVSEVWPQVSAIDPVSELLIVGKGAPPSVRRIIAQTPRVCHAEFVTDLGQVYADAMVALSPVFKGFGLINKTLEAMASGLPVVGGQAAFNGIPGFQSGVHGVACEGRSTEQFVDALRGMLSDPNRCANVGAQARELVEGNFRWESAVDEIRGLLDRTVH
jgi:polysaccharide biosynthesis protein PslH